MRIFIGTEDIAQCLTGLALGFRALGHSVTTMVTTRPWYAPESHYDYVCGYEISRRFNFKSARLRGIASILDRRLSIPLTGLLNNRRFMEHDMYVFVHYPWLPERLLYPYLKKGDKKLVVYYLGSDVRHATAFAQQYGDGPFVFDRTRDPLDSKIARIRYAELYADAVYSVPDQAGLQIRPFRTTRIPLADVHSIRSNIPGRTVPKIVHAPTKQDQKGTRHILAALNELRTEGVDFDLVFLDRVSHRELLKLLEDADILIDELFFHGPGVLSAEAMAAGCAVATHVLPEEVAPVVSISPADVKEKVRRLIGDVSFRVDLARQGISWARERYDPRAVAADILEHLRGARGVEHHPRFFLDRYRLLPGDRLSSHTRRLSARVALKYGVDRERLDGAARRGLLSLP